MKCESCGRDKRLGIKPAQIDPEGEYESCRHCGLLYPLRPATPSPTEAFDTEVKAEIAQMFSADPQEVDRIFDTIMLSARTKLAMAAGVAATSRMLSDVERFFRIMGRDGLVDDTMKIQLFHKWIEKEKEDLAKEETHGQRSLGR